MTAPAIVALIRTRRSWSGRGGGARRRLVLPRRSPARYAGRDSVGERDRLAAVRDEVP